MTIVEAEKQRRETKGLQERSTRITVRRPTLGDLQEHVRNSVVEHDGVLPKESALVLFRSFASLLTWGLLSIEDFQTLMNTLPEYPDDPTVERLLTADLRPPGVSNDAVWYLAAPGRLQRTAATELVCRGVRLRW